MFIVRPDMADEDVDKLIGTLESNVTTAGGTVKHTERMGKRRLAYTVRKFNEGLYILLTLQGTGEMIHEVERRLRVTEPVIKFISVRVDEEHKRLDKIKALRASRVKRSPVSASTAAAAAVAVAAPAAEPAAEAGSEPATATV